MQSLDYEWTWLVGWYRLRRGGWDGVRLIRFGYEMNGNVSVHIHLREKLRTCMSVNLEPYFYKDNSARVVHLAYYRSSANSNH